MNSRVVEIVFAGEQCIHDLADDHQRRIAGIVVDIFQSDIDRRSVVVWQDDQIVAACVECRLRAC